MKLTIIKRSGERIHLCISCVADIINDNFFVLGTQKCGFFVSPMLIPENGQHCMWLAEIMAPTWTKELDHGRLTHMLSPAKSQENILDVVEKGIFDVFCALESSNFLR